MLKIPIEKDIVQAADFKPLFADEISHVNISKAIRKLRQQNFLRPLDGEKSRRYTIRLNRNALTLGVVMQLDTQGYLPIQDSQFSK